MLRNVETNQRSQQKLEDFEVFCFCNMRRPSCKKQNEQDLEHTGASIPILTKYTHTHVAFMAWAQTETQMTTIESI